MKNLTFPEQEEKEISSPFRLMIQAKEAVRKELYCLYHEQEEGFDESLQRDLDFWLLTFRKEFFTRRYPEYIAKIIVHSNELIRTLEWQISINSKKRHLTLVVTPSLMISPFSSKAIIGCLLGIQLDSSSEMISRNEVQEALDACSMGFELLDSFYKHNPYSSSIHIFYFEMGYQENDAINSINLSLFEKMFLKQIETRIQVLVPPLFMQRNEEEVMRNLLILRRETSSIQDIPQVIIFYDNHTHQEITFTILLVRVKKSVDSSVLDLLRLSKENEEYIEGQVYFLGNFSEESIIDGNVFQIRLKNISRFQRKNSSIDYNLSRKKITEYLQISLGEVRDYNGGMFLKQDERLKELKESFPEATNNYPEILENFFYSIWPIEKQATLPLELFSAFFKLFHTLFIEDQVDFLIEGCDLKLIIALKYEDEKELSRNEELFFSDEASYKKTVSSKWSYGDFLFKGFILSFHTINELQEYEKRIRERLTQTSDRSLSQKKILHINNDFIQFDFDPRIGGTNESIAINKLLFDGLTRINSKGEKVLSCANSYNLSSDRKTYTFQLKELYWSNGQLLTADDFEYAWKKILSPEFETRFAYLFYLILNAKEAKEGKTSLDDVGIKVLSKKILQVQIKHPAPYFLELLAHSLFSPVNSDIDRNDPSWSSGRNDSFVCNGPFKLKKSPRPFYEFELEPNPYYWNRQELVLDGISISNVNPQKALKMFKNRELDWLGPPFGIPKLEFSKFDAELCIQSKSKVFWYCFNVHTFPLSNMKIREALFYLVDRNKIIQGIQGTNEPSYSPLPKEHTFFPSSNYCTIENQEKAFQCFHEGMKELGISQKSFLPLRIIYPDNETFYKISKHLKDQIENCLGIQCPLVGVNYGEFFERMVTGDFEIGAMRWVSWVDDPIYTLEIFKNKNEKMNFANWENINYQSLIDKAQHEENQQERKKLLFQAEKILIDDFVILSLFYGEDYFLKNPDLIVPDTRSLAVIDLSLLDFKSR
ncbi:MAG: peptide ABC transporter substrate-binding protein [Simkaniaceae bacterium]|nr:MAG: peptide ABC transporter substrate-binding protein [Simkaniaceae bacterium]